MLTDKHVTLFRYSVTFDLARSRIAEMTYGNNGALFDTADVDHCKCVILYGVNIAIMMCNS